MENREKNLAELYKKTQSGDREALQELCKTLEEFIRGYFWQKFQNNSIVDDLCQETHLRLLKNLPLVRERMKLRSFVAKVALHVSQDYLRQKYRRKEEGLEITYENDAEREQHLKTEGEPPEEADRILDQVLLSDALKTLPEKSREILMMKSQGYNYEEIAAEMDLSVSGVKMQVKRSIEALRLAIFDVTFLFLSATSLLELI